MRQERLNGDSRTVGEKLCRQAQADEFVRAARQGLEYLPRWECRLILEQITKWSVRREK